MNMFIVWQNESGVDSEPEHTRYEYALGETIRVNSSDIYKCMKKQSYEGNLYHYFKKGIVSYNFNY